MQPNRSRQPQKRRMPIGHDPSISGTTAQALLERAGFQGVEILGPDGDKSRGKDGGTAAWAEGFMIKIGWFSGWLMVDWSESGIEIQEQFWKRWGAVTQDDMYDIMLKGEYILVTRRLLERTLTIICDILLSQDN